MTHTSPSGVERARSARGIRGQKARRLAVGVGVTVLSIAAPAGAAFPGRDGDIAFDDGNGELGSIYDIHRDGSGLGQLRGGGAPVYSPGGGRIVFQRLIEDPDGQYGGDFYRIYRMRSDGTNVRRLRDTATSAKPMPSWSPSGRKIVFRGRDGLRKMRAADGSRVERITRVSEEEPVWLADKAPVWSPTGGRIAFVRGDDIYSVSSDGTNERRLTDTESVTEGPPDWSPDGEEVVFGVFDFHGPTNYEIHVMDADGSDERTLTGSPSETVETPVFSPSGAKIAFQQNSDRSSQTSSIWTMNRDGSEPREVGTGYGRKAFNPDWQPR